MGRKGEVEEPLKSASSGQAAAVAFAEAAERNPPREDAGEQQNLSIKSW